MVGFPEVPASRPGMMPVLEASSQSPPGDIGCMPGMRLGWIGTAFAAGNSNQGGAVPGLPNFNSF